MQWLCYYAEQHHLAHIHTHIIVTFIAQFTASQKRLIRSHFRLCNFIIDNITCGSGSGSGRGRGSGSFGGSGSCSFGGSGSCSCSVSTYRNPDRYEGVRAVMFTVCNYFFKKNNSRTRIKRRRRNTSDGDTD